MHRGRLHPVTGDADRVDQPFVLRADGTLDRSAGTGRSIEVVWIADAVELDQVETIDLQSLE